MKERLIKDIELIVNSLSNKDEIKLDFIINKYNKLKELILNNKLNTNIIKGSVRAYLDVFSDYENPVLEQMSKMEKNIDDMIQ
jgi:hypothetical protein